jgi:hypothetical protein
MLDILYFSGSKMLNEQLSERIKKEIGDEVDETFVEELLKRDTIDLLCWIQNNHEAIIPTIQEAIQYAEAYQESNNTDAFMLNSTTHILESNVRIILFLLKEIKTRIETATSSNKTKYS